MTTFDKREEGFEKQFAHDEELRFKATARRNKLLGLWAAEKLGLAGAEADSYALVGGDGRLRSTGTHDVVRKIRKDFDAKGVDQSDHQIAPHHDRADGAGDRRHQSRQVTPSHTIDDDATWLMPIPAFQPRQATARR